MKRDRSFATAQEVADLAGVSRSAVSRTFTPGASVSPRRGNAFWLRPRRSAITSTIWRGG